MDKDLKLITRGFKNEILCYYKELGNGVYDVYAGGLCIGVGLTEIEVKKLNNLLKSSCSGLLNN